MSGAEVKAQVMKALWDTSNALVPGTLEASRAEAAIVLSDCVVLTAEEAEGLRNVHHATIGHIVKGDRWSS